MVKDQGKTGNFEVTVNGQLAHSKQTTGNFPVSTEYLNAIYDAIETQLERTIDVSDVSLQESNSGRAFHEVSDKQAIRRGMHGVQVYGLPRGGESQSLLPYKSEDIKDEQRKSLYVSLCIMAVQIPAIIGA